MALADIIADFEIVFIIWVHHLTGHLSVCMLIGAWDDLSLLAVFFRLILNGVKIRLDVDWYDWEILTHWRRREWTGSVSLEYIQSFVHHDSLRRFRGGVWSVDGVQAGAAVPLLSIMDLWHLGFFIMLGCGLDLLIDLY